MNAREFVVYAKKNAVDDTLASVARELRTPRVYPQATGDNEIERGISGWIQAQQRRAQERSEWFLGLNQEGQQRVIGLMQECAEMTLASFFCLIDGVGGDYEGNFEIVAVDGEEQRTIVNPENADMLLHDLLSEACAEDSVNEQSGL